MPENEDSHYGAVVNYTCENNGTFVDGTMSKTTQCMSDGNWSPDVVVCPGSNIIRIKTMMNIPLLKHVLILSTNASVPLTLIWHLYFYS